MKQNEKQRQIRLRTITLRGVLSQGLALPIDVLKHFDNSYTPQKYKIGDDVTTIMGIEKYVPPAAKMANIIGEFPSIVPKTEQVRLQSCPELLQEINDIECYITEKLDGTSATYIFNEGEFIMCSRNCILRYDQTGGCLWTRIASEYQLPEKLQKLGKNIAVQGEICGPEVQGNKLGLSKLMFSVFSIFDIDNQKYLSYSNLKEVATSLNLETVPILQDSFLLPQDIPDGLAFFLKLAEGKYPKSKKEREGIVVCAKEETYSEALKGRLSFKVISNKFLLKNKEA